MNHQIYNLTANRHEISNEYLSKDTIDGWIAVSALREVEFRHFKLSKILSYVFYTAFSLRNNL